MARLLTDQFHPGVPADLPAHQPLTQPATPPASQAPTLATGAASVARAALLTAIVVGLAVGLLLTVTLAGPVQQAPDLAALLRGMVMIKGLILVVVASVLFWRLGRAIRPRTLLGYGAGLALAAAALGWLWGLTWVPLGSLLFWGGLGAVFVVAQRDRLLFDSVDGDRAG